MPLSCQDSDRQEIGISLRHIGAKRYVRSRPGDFIPLSSDSWPVTTGQVFIGKNVEILTDFEAKPPEWDEQVSNAAEKSFLFDLDSSQLEVSHVSHAVRWDQDQKLLKTFGQPGFVGAVFMHVKPNQPDLPIPFVVACGLGSRSVPWICLAAPKEYLFHDPGSDLYEAAVAQDWDSVRLAMPILGSYYGKTLLTLKNESTGAFDVQALRVPTRKGLGCTEISLRVMPSVFVKGYAFGFKLGAWLAWPHNQASRLKEKLKFRTTSNGN